MGNREDDLAAHGDDLRDALHWETLIESSLIEHTDYGYPIPYPPRPDVDLA